MKAISLSVIIVPLWFAACGDRAESSADSAPAAAPVPYPLNVCLVSGEELGSMGEPVVIVHEGREIKFCCDSCLPKFEADPGKYLSQLGGGDPADAGHDHH